MTERVYPILPDDKMNFMMDKQKALREKLAHYKKIKKKWSCANTALKITGISLSSILCGASILTMTPFSIPIAAAILGGISLGNTAVTNLLTERFTSKRKKYFRQKCDHIKDYLNKMETLFIKCKEDGQISVVRKSRILDQPLWKLKQEIYTNHFRTFELITFAKKILLARVSFDFTSLHSVSSHSTPRSSYFFYNSFSFHSPFIPQLAPLASSFILREMKKKWLVQMS